MSEPSTGAAPSPDEGAERTDHDDPEMYRHRDDPEPDAGEGTGDAGPARA
ncbi:hypothetical protein [Aquipuribacter sp. SD81]